MTTRDVSLLIALALIGLGVTVCAAWWLRFPLLIQVAPGNAPMQFNTALLFLLAGAGLMASRFEAERVMRVLAAVVGLFALLTLVQYLAEVDFGLDQLFVRAYLLDQTSHPGRMAPNSAAAFILSALGLFLLAYPRRRVVAAALGTMVIAMGMASLLGYMLDIKAAYGWGQLTRMAIHAAVGFLLLGGGLLLAYRERRQLAFEPFTLLPWRGLMAALFLSILSLLFWQALRSEDAAQQRQQLQQKATTEASVLASLARERLQTIDRMCRRFSEGIYGSMQDGQADVRWFLEMMTSFDYVAVHGPEGKQLVAQARPGLDIGVLAAAAPPLMQEPGCKIDGKDVNIWFSCARADAGGRLWQINARAHLEIVALNEIERQSLEGYEVSLHATLQEPDKVGTDLVAYDRIPDPLPPFWVQVRALGPDPISRQSRLPDVLLVTGLILALLLAVVSTQQHRLRLANQEIRKANEELAARSDALAASNESLEQFAYAASHDLKAPVRTMVSFAQIIGKQDKKASIESVSELLDEIVSAGKGLYGMIDTLMEVSRAGRIDPASIRRVSMHTVLDRVLKRLDALIRERDAQIEIGELPELETEPHLMAQVLQNLIVNAIKYQPGEKPYVGVFARKEAKGWVFSVADRGRGIDPKYHEEIFRLFRRGNPSDVEGSGVGLATTRRIINGLGGRIWVESTLGAGATFRFFHASKPILINV